MKRPVARAIAARYRRIDERWSSTLRRLFGGDVQLVAR